MKEAKFTADFRKALVRLGGQMIVIPGMTYQSGQPDRYVHHRVWRGLVEFKREGGKLGEQQRVTIEKLWRQAPGSVFVVWPGWIMAPDAVVRGDWSKWPWGGDVSQLLRFFQQQEQWARSLDDDHS